MSSATEGIVIYLALDQSGSMKERVFATTPSGTDALISKMDLAKAATVSFIEGDPKNNLPGRYNDLIGLVSFARTSQVLAPLTLDHDAILKLLKDVSVVTDSEQDGTALGYAIYKTTHLIAATRQYAQQIRQSGKGTAPYDIKSAIIVLVTDGFQSPNPLDKKDPLRTIGLQEAAEYALKNNVKLYVINVDPRIKEPAFTPHRNQMQRIVSSTKGKFYIVDDATSLSAIYNDINQLERGTIIISEKTVSTPQTQNKTNLSYNPNLYTRISLYPFLIGLGLFLLATALIRETVFVRRIP